jgi:hypothetical protein
LAGIVVESAAAAVVVVVGSIQQVQQRRSLAVVAMQLSSNLSIETEKAERERERHKCLNRDMKANTPACVEVNKYELFANINVILGYSRSQLWLYGSVK